MSSFKIGDLVKINPLGLYPWGLYVDTVYIVIDAYPEDGSAYVRLAHALTLMPVTINTVRKGNEVKWYQSDDLTTI